jgi:hypothetical protein
MLARRQWERRLSPDRVCRVLVAAVGHRVSPQLLLFTHFSPEHPERVIDCEVIHY